MPSDLSSHVIRLGSGPWLLWRECAIRSAGLPASMASRFSDPVIAREAEAAGSGDLSAAAYEAAYDRARWRSVDALRSFVDDARFREAVAWQNPTVAREWMCRLARSGDNRKLRKARYASAVTAYAQRYTTKNDTISYFGPVGWARWEPTVPGVEVRTGRHLLRSRTLYFEDWTIVEIARRLSREPALQRWARPRPVAGCHREGTVLHRPYGAAVVLEPAQARLLDLCDGSRSVTTICEALGHEEQEVIKQLRAWSDSELVHFDYVGPVEARPEITLRAALDGVGDPDARRWALDVLARMEEARDALCHARGDPERVVEELTALDRTFVEVTGMAPSRRPGQSYAGRTLVYEEATRDLDVVLGGRILDRLAPPLDIVLSSASWLVARAGAALLEALRQIVHAHCQRHGVGGMRLPDLLARATRILHPQAGGDSPLAQVRTAFQRQWAELVGLPADGRQHTVTVRQIAGRSTELFPAQPPPWPGAVHFSPDLMIVPADRTSLTSGNCTFVLGELHLANNTLQARPFVQQHDHPEALVTAVEADYGRTRTYSVPTRKWPQVNSRTYPGAILARSYRYWCLHDDSGGAAGPVLPAAAMTVYEEDGSLFVRTPDGARLPLADVLDEQLSWAVVNLFQPIADGPHQPRVSLDSLVLHRETWQVDPADLSWLLRTGPAERFRLVQPWRQRLGMPMRVFYRTQRGAKPCYLDFSSPALVEHFCRQVAAGRGDARSSPVTVTEMLPDLDHVWLPDHRGETYTSEFRMVCVNPGAAG